MPLSSFEYIYNKHNINKNNIFGYFDFENTGYSGKSILPTLITNQDSKLLILNSGSGVWKNSGELNLDSNTYLKYSGSISDSYMAGLVFEKNAEKEFILFSSLGSTSGIYSGFNVGINSYGFAYVEYLDNYYGTVNVLNTKYRYKSNGNLFIEVDPYSCAIGVFDEFQSFQRTVCKFNSNGYIPSSEIYIGGSSKITGYNLDGKIFEFIIQPSDFESYDPNLTFSGFKYSINTVNTTGYISGQTGVLYGDIISISGCQYVTFLSGGNYQISQYTGIKEYIQSENAFFDFNDDIYYKFTTSVVTGVIYSGQENANTIASSCFDNITYKDVFNYNSGYLINYYITTFYPSIKNRSFLEKKSNGLLFSRLVFTGTDILNLLFVDDNLNNQNLTNFAQTNNNFIAISPDEDDANQNWSLFFNGQLQRPSDNYTSSLINGNMYYIPENDFLKSGGLFYNTNVYKLNQGNLIADFINIPAEYYSLNSPYNSGEQIDSIKFENSLIYLNGQLLTSGIDYTGNIIQFNIDSGYNCLIKQSLSGLDYKNIILNSGKILNTATVAQYIDGYLSLNTEEFDKNSSMVWLNGVRMALNKDYAEIETGIFSDLFIETNGYIIYNNVI